MGKRLQPSLSQCLLAPFPEPSHCQRPRTKQQGYGGKKNLCSLPAGLPGWCVGDLNSKRKAATPPFTRDPSQGLPALFSTPSSGRGEREPSLMPKAAGGLRDGQHSIYQLESRCGRWRGGSGRGGDRGRSGRVLLGPERWLGYERWSRSGVQWAGLSWVRAAPGD